VHTLIDEEIIAFHKVLKLVAVLPGDTCLRRLLETWHGRCMGESQTEGNGTNLAGMQWVSRTKRTLFAKIVFFMK
jgi:hypothetical protein